MNKLVIIQNPYSGTSNKKSNLIGLDMNLSMHSSASELEEKSLFCLFYSLHPTLSGVLLRIMKHMPSVS